MEVHTLVERNETTADISVSHTLWNIVTPTEWTLSYLF